MSETGGSRQRGVDIQNRWFIIDKSGPPPAAGGRADPRNLQRIISLFCRIFKPCRKYPGKGGSPMLELQDLSYSVSGPEGETDILKNISLTIPDKRLVVLTGPNGGGKTTLARAHHGPGPAHRGTDFLGRDGHHRRGYHPAGPDGHRPTGFSSRPGSRASGYGTCWPWPRTRSSCPRGRPAPT